MGAGASAGAIVPAVPPRAGTVPQDVPDAVFVKELTFEVARVLEESEAAVDPFAR